MGISFSCAGCEYDNIFNEYIETFFMRSISFKAGDVETTLRSLSFKGQEAPTILKSFESGKMIIEESVNFKGRNTNPLDLGTIGSYKAPPLAKDCARVTNFKESEISSPCGRCNNPMGRIQCLTDLPPCSPIHEAAVKLQKVYKSFRTRRQLADCAVLVEQHWWKLLDFATLKRSSVSFFDIEKPETAVSRWSRARTRAAKVGKGLSKNVKARKLALQHWLEAIDPRHRYGHNLHFYYDTWLNCDSRQPFFYWLDVGEGRDCNIERCSRSKLQQQCIKYLGPKEREAYEVIVENGKFLYKQTLELLDTSEGSEDAKWIFVLSTSKALYVGQKLKGTFQHSSFLAGGATSAAGGLEVEKGVLKAVWRHSGHYRPTAENFRDFFSFLSENNVDLSDVKNGSIDGEEVSLSREESSHNGLLRESTELDLTAKVQELAIDQASNEVDPLLKLTIAIPRKTDLYEKLETEAQMKAAPGSTNFSAETFPVPDEVEEEPSTPEEYMTPKWNLFEEDHEEDEKNVPEESILRRINSREGMKSYQLGKQLSFKWTTGAGPRIACVRDYPMEIQCRALEKMSLSPRSIGNSRALPLKTRRLDSQELTLTCPSPLSTSEANITSFCNNY